MKNLLNFFLKYNYWFLFVLLEIISFALLFRFNSYQGSAFFTSANFVSGAMYDAANNVTGYFHLKTINDELVQKNVELELQLESIRKALIEATEDSSGVEQLKQEALAGYDIFKASVINNSVTHADNYITLDHKRISICKDPENKNCLVIDEYAADIVKEIFAWKIEGFSLNVIAKKLNRRHEQSPKEYKLSNGINFNSGFQGSSTPKWSSVQIKRILTNEVYIGNMVQGKQERISYKLKARQNKPEEEWIKVTDTHPAIINQNEFELVQRLLKYDGRALQNTGVSNLFSGFLFCGDCKTPMIRKVNKYKGKKKAFYICQTKNKGGACTRHSIQEDVLKQIVLKEISSYMLLFIDYEMSMEKLQELEINYDQVISHDFQISRLQEEYNKYYGLKMSLYDDLKTGLIDKTEFNEFREIYDAKCEELDQTIKYQKQLIREIFDGSVAIKVQIEDWKKAIDIKELDRSLLALTVDAIYVFEDKKIEIHFRYQDMVEKMKIIRDFCLNQVTDNMKEVV